MKKQNKSESDILRQKAEKLLSDRRDKACLVSTPKTAMEQVTKTAMEQVTKTETATETDLLKLIHELEVNQIELEMQNDELMVAKSAAQDAIDLYDFAPTSYFTLSKEGDIINLNLCAALMLGKERSYLIANRFSLFISDDTKPIFNLFFDKIFSSKTKEFCEVTLTIKGASPIWLHLTGIVTGNGEKCHITAVDITERRLAEKSLQDIIANNPMSIQILDMEGYTIQTNSAHYNLFGTGVPEGYSLFKDPQLLKLGFGELFDRIKHGEVVTFPDSHFNPHYVDPSFPDSLVTVKATGFPLTGENGRPDKIVLMQENITERKKTEEALRESEEKFSRIFDTSPFVIIVTDAVEGKIIEVNKAFTTISGYTREEAVADSTIGLRLWANIEDRNQVVSALTEGREVSSKEFLFRTKNGETITGLFSAQVIHIGNKPYILSSIDDISDRKIAEEKIRLSEEKYRTIFENFRDVYYEATNEGIILDVSPSITIISKGQYTRDELIGMSLVGFYADPDARNSFFSELQKRGYVTDYELSFRNKDGSIVPIAISSSLLFDADGKPVKIAGNMRDITERKKSEENLRNSENRYYSIFQGSADGIMIAEEETKMILYANSAQCTMLGYTEEQLQSMNISEIHPVETIQDILAEFERQSRGEKTLAENIQCCRKNGEIFYADINSHSVKINGQNLMIGFFRDITERRLAEQKIHNLNESLELKVNERTAQLAKTNKSLENEIQRRKLVEIELEREKQRLADIIKGTNTGTWEWNIQTGETVYNERWFEIIGYTQEELAPVNILTWIDFIHPDDLIKAIELKEKHLKGEFDYFSLEFRMLHKNGEWIWVLNRGKVHTWDDDGKPLLMSGTHQDITEQKRVESLLIQTRHNYETFFNTIDDFLFVMDQQGNIIHTNTTVIVRLGYSIEELSGKSVLMVHPSERREEAGRIVGEMLAGTADFCPVPLITKSGNYIPVETRVKQGFWDGMSVIFGVSKDISKIKLSEEKFSKAFQSNAALMAISTLDGRFINVNNSFVKALEYSLDEIIGKTSGELRLFDDPSLRAILTEKLSKNIPVREVEVAVRTKSGSKIIGLFSADLISVGEETCLLTMVVDITERKRMEEDLKKARREADSANVAKSEFLSRMSHELRTPMNSILGFAQLMEMGELSPAHRKNVGFILSSGKHLLSLINEVLNIASIESGRIALLLEPVQLSGIINQMLGDAYPIAAKRNLKTELEYSPDNLLFVRADRQRFQQVLINLINNSIKYNSEGGSVIIRTKLQQHASPGISFVRISVSDTGIGIIPEDINKLFQPFERIGAEKTLTEGTGLGLMVVKKLITAMGGDVGVESVPSEGSTFWVELPLIENQTLSKEQIEDKEKLIAELRNANEELAFQNEEKAKRAAELTIANEELAFQSEEKAKRAAELIIANKELKFQSEEKAKRAAELIIANKELAIQKEGYFNRGTILTKKTGTILYFEDNIPNAELVELIIASYFPTIRLITSRYGKHAVTFASDYEPDIILLDIDLPDISGNEVIKLLQSDEKTKSIPVVVISADAMPHQIELMMNAGAFEYLTKPLDILAFLKVVDDLMGG